jgi:hypothetical protein
MSIPPACSPNLHTQPSQETGSGQGPTSGPWNLLADLAVLGIWIAVVGISLRHHEKWADEAQAWLLARDLDLRTLWFRELRYEGCPGLWHSILWVAQHGFHLPYAAMGIIGAVFAMAGVALMLFKAPFPRPVRWLLAFSYYMVYQYTVVARPYTMFPLFAFAAAIFFKDLKHPERITIALILLANVNAHGTLLAACIGLAYLIEAISAWSNFDAPLRRRFALSISAMLLTYIFLFMVLKPPPDVEALQDAHQRTAGQVASKAMQGIAGAFFDSPVLALLWLSLVAAWCRLRKRLIVFLLPIVVLGIFYGVVNGWAHQQGTIFVAAITGLWIAWPTPQDEAAFSPHQKHAYFVVIAMLVCLLGYETWNAAVIIRNDYRGPYSGAEDTAMYLKSVGADKRPIVGYLYAMVAVQAYFDHNIQANLPTAYAHHGLPLLGVTLDPAELKRLDPDYVVFPCWEDCVDTLRKIYEPFMQAEGYSLVHASDGYLFWKRAWDLRQIYFVFRRG